MAYIIDPFIVPSLSAFIYGWSTLSTSLLILCIPTWGPLLKLDFEKVFYFICWDFIQFIMWYMGLR